jgi:hypothetical protein
VGFSLPTHLLINEMHMEGKWEGTMRGREVATAGVRSAKRSFIDNRPGAGSSLGSALAAKAGFLIDRGHVRQPRRAFRGSHCVGATTLLALKTRISMVHVPFKGTGPALNALLGGEINMEMSTFASALPHVKQGRLRAEAKIEPQ